MIRYFKAAYTNVLTSNYIEIKRKTGSLSKGTEGIKNKMEILKLKNNWNLKITEMKNLNSRMEMPEKRVSETEDIIQSEQQAEKKIGKKLNKASGICKILIKVLRFMLLKSQKERSKSMELNKYLKKCLKTT